MSGHLEFRTMLAGDAVQLAVQPSQHMELGLHRPLLSIEDGRDLADNGLAWCAHRAGRIIGLAGFRQLFSGHAVAWAALSLGIGADHLAITRFAREQIELAPYRRIEAIVDADDGAAIAWAKLVGLNPAHVLHCYGEAGTPHILFERVKA